MEKIYFENEVCKYLNLPSIPVKEWDGKSSFKSGVAIVNGISGLKYYAICGYDADNDKEPSVKKVFSQEPFNGIEKILVVPSYMDTDLKDADLDEESKAAAERMIQESEEIIEETSEGEPAEEENEWVFPDIHNIEEARAFIQSWNSRNKVKGKIPTNEETIKLRLLSIQSQMKNK